MIEAASGDVDENAAGAMVGAVTASDVDDGDMHTYTVSDDRFEVADGMLKLKDDQMLDHEMEDSVMVTVTVTDSGDLSASMDVTVGVNDLNEAPSRSRRPMATPWTRTQLARWSARSRRPTSRRRRHAHHTTVSDDQLRGRRRHAQAEGRRKPGYSW